MSNKDYIEKNINKDNLGLNLSLYINNIEELNNKYIEIEKEINSTLKNLLNNLNEETLEKINENFWKHNLEVYVENGEYEHNTFQKVECISKEEFGEDSMFFYTYNDILDNQDKLKLILCILKSIEDLQK